MWYEQLTTQEKSLVEQQVSNNKKNFVIAYILWFILGHLGAHRFYLKGFSFGAVLQAVLGVVGWATSYILIGYVLLVPLWIWLFIDLFLIPRMANSRNDELREEYSEQIIARR